jgi:phosphotriesterase-related protein
MSRTRIRRREPEVAIIRTVLGDVPADQIGRTLAHEHILYSYPGAEWDHRTLFDVEEAADRIAKEIREGFEPDGYRTLVEMTPVEVGRHPVLMAEVAKRSGVNVIAITGFFPESIGLPYYWKRQTVDELAAFFVRDITEGMVFAGVKTKICAGAIKIATGQEGRAKHASPKQVNGLHLTESEERVIRAAGRAQRQLDCGINTHTDPTDYTVTNPGMEQLDLLEEEGANLWKVAVGHVLIRPTGIEQAVEICDRGASINIDHVGIPWKYDSAEELDDFMADEICELARRGYTDRMVLSFDRWFFNPRTEVTDLDPDMPNERTPLSYMFESFIPRLLKKGFPEDGVDKLLVENPRRIFSIGT